MTDRIVRIGGAVGFWGESAAAVPQLLARGRLDYLVFDYLAEITMSILARARAADPNLGYATDFVSAVLEPNLAEIARQGVRVISNAGGVNPVACGEAIRRLVDAAGLDLDVAVVTGDDLMGEVNAIAAGGVRELYSGAPLPPAGRIASVNAYLGARPIAAALDAGADIVITGRVVDSAVTLGACLHEFGWSERELDQMAGASLAGHILECSTQATGGNFTDWECVAERAHEIGYPIAEVSADGSFVVTKPPDTGGLVSTGTVAEQMLYEIGDPQAYVLPDVVCDFASVRLERVGDDRVRVTGARGRPATDSYKVSATYADGYRGGQVLFFYGFDADRKARAFASSALARAAARLDREGLGEFGETLVEVFGDESHYGAARRIGGAREVALKIAARHADQRAIGLLLREIVGGALAAPPGLTFFSGGGRPKPSPVVRLFSFLKPKTEVPAAFEMGHGSQPVAVPPGVPFDPVDIRRPPAPPAPDLSSRAVEVPLVKLAWGRSGDKGNNANVGIIARRAEYLPFIWAALTEAAVAGRYAHFLDGRVERFLLPGSNAINFLLHDVLGGGGVASLRNDPQGKGYAQILLDHPIPVAEHLLGSIA
jgi:hypothetical protein